MCQTAILSRNETPTIVKPLPQSSATNRLGTHSPFGQKYTRGDQSRLSLALRLFISRSMTRAKNPVGHESCRAMNRGGKPTETVAKCDFAGEGTSPHAPISVTPISEVGACRNSGRNAAQSRARRGETSPKNVGHVSVETTYDPYICGRRSGKTYNPSQLSEIKHLHINRRMLVSMVQLETDISIGKPGFMDDIDSLYTVEPGLNVMPFGNHVIVIPVVGMN